MLHVMPGKARTQDAEITGLYLMAMMYAVTVVLFVSALFIRVASVMKYLK